MAEDFAIIATHIRNLLNKVDTLEKKVASLSNQNSGPSIAQSRPFSREHRMFPCVVTSVSDDNQIVCKRIVPVDGASTEQDPYLTGIPIITRIPIGGSAPSVGDEIFVSHIGDGHYLPIGGAGGGGGVFPGIIQGASGASSFDAYVNLYENGFGSAATETLVPAIKGNNDGPYGSGDYCFVYQVGDDYYFWASRFTRLSGQIVGGASNPYNWYQTTYPGGSTTGSQQSSAYEMNGLTTVTSGTHVILYKVYSGFTYSNSQITGQTASYYFTAGSMNAQQVFPAKIKTVVTPGVQYTVDLYENGFGSSATALNLTANQVDLFSYNYAVGDQIAVFADNSNYYIISAKPFQITNIPQLQFAKILSGSNPYTVNLMQSPVGSPVTPVQTLTAYEFSGSTIVAAGTYVPLQYSPYDGTYFFFYPLGECS